jgi:hypothetical protein
MQFQQNWVAQDSSWSRIWKMAVFESCGWNLAGAVLENGAADQALIPSLYWPISTGRDRPAIEVQFHHQQFHGGSLFTMITRNPG